MSFRPLLLAAPAALAALTAGLMLSAPASALDSGVDDLLELAQATPPSPPGAGTDRRERMAAFNPKAFCLDRVARQAGNRTYLKVRLELKPEQMTAWNAFEKAADDASVKELARCNALPSERKDRPNYVDRLTLEEDAMKARVARIEAVKPTLLAFYNTLSPEQKAVLDGPTAMGGMMMRRHHGPR